MDDHTWNSLVGAITETHTQTMKYGQVIKPSPVRPHHRSPARLHLAAARLPGQRRRSRDCRDGAPRGRRRGG